MGSSGGYITLPKLFGGEYYNFYDIYRTKREAQTISKKFHNEGHRARVIKTGHWYALYWRKI
jgi:hypothetical protein